MSDVNWSLATQANPNAYDALDSLKAIGNLALQKIQGQAFQASTAATQQKTQADQFALGQDQQQAAARPGIAAAAAAGDYTGAATQALATGDTNAFAGVRNLHSDDLDKMKLEASAMGDAAYTLSSIKDPAQRAQAFARMAPQLKQAGFADHELAAAGADLSDAKLAWFQNHSLGAKTAIENEQKNRQLSQVDKQTSIQQQNADTERYTAEHTASYQQGELQNNGWKSVQPGEELHYVGGGTPSSGGVPTGGATGGAWKVPQLTDVASALGGRITSGLRTPEQNAAVGGVPNSQHLSGTAIDVVFPKGTTAAQVQAAYAAKGAPVQVIHEGANDPHSTGDHFHIQATPGARTTGGSTGGGTPGVITNSATSGPPSSQDLKAADYVIDSGGKSPPGYTSRDRVSQAKLRAALDQRLQERGLTDQDIINNGLNLKGQQSFLTGWNNRNGGGSTVRSINVAVNHIDQLRQAANALQNGNIPMFNQFAQSIAQATGHAAPTTFDGLKSLVADEVTKGVIGASGALSDRAGTANSVLHQASPAQLSGMMHGWYGLMGGQLDGLRRQYQTQGGRNDFDKFVSPRARQILGQHGGGEQHPADIQALLGKYGKH